MAAPVKSDGIDLEGIDSATEVYSFERTLPHYMPNSSVHGMGWNATWLSAIAGTANGKEYFLARAYTSDTTANFFVLELSHELWELATPRVAPVPELASLYWGEIRWNLHPDHVEVVSNNEALPPLRLELRPDRFHLVEGDFCDIVFHPLKGERFALWVPGEPEPVGYNPEPSTITGTIEGSEIIWGLGNHERLYGGPYGSSWYRGKISTHLENIWITWGTTVLGGPREFGMIFFGLGEFCGAYHVVEGEEMVKANRMDFCDIDWETRDGRSRPARLKFGFGGREFEANMTGTLQVPGPDLDLKYLTGEVRQTNRDGALTCRGFSEMLNRTQAG